MIPEKFLHYVWQHGLFEKHNLRTNDNEPIEIISPGTLNSDAGPDFFNAKIKIGKTIWAGNVEIHISALDWEKHGHNKNDSYGNIILHVVSSGNMEIYRSDGTKIPTLTLKYNKKILNSYNELIASKNHISCSEKLYIVDDFTIKMYMQSLAIERLQRKSDDIIQLYEKLNRNWEETLYVQLARCLGLKINSVPFEMLAKSVSLSIIQKHRDNILQLEALLFGQAGFLSNNIDDSYFVNLKTEYNFLKSKYKLKPIDKHLWKFLRLRPSGFPTIRISQFAHILNSTTNLFSKLIVNYKYTDFINILNVSASEYWETHYTFNTFSAGKTKNLA